MHKITFLGPVGATFSHDAYDVLAEIYRAPKVVAGDGETNCVPATSNGEILGIIQEHGGYGAIAMETLAELRIEENVISFIRLLKTYYESGKHQFHIVGAIRKELHFCLMARPGVEARAVQKIVAHPKAYGACKDKIEKLGAVFVSANSNGEAARLVAENDEHALSAALGPLSASEKYGLTVIDSAFEDKRAVTTFFLVAPTSHQVSTGEESRLLVVFKVPHKPGALVDALIPFKELGLNMIYLSSSHAGDMTYDWVIEVEVGKHQLIDAQRALEKLKECVVAHLAFGPFEVLSR